ncbi:MAG: HNH endonuclease [Candidatus Paceibacterota bacterium]
MGANETLDDGGNLDYDNSNSTEWLPVKEQKKVIYWLCLCPPICSGKPQTQTKPRGDFLFEVIMRSNYHRGNSQIIKNRLIEERGNICNHCGENLYLELDHIIPLWNGGSNEDDNLQLLCRECHKNKSSIDARNYHYRYPQRMFDNGIEVHTTKQIGMFIRNFELIKRFDGSKISQYPYQDN